MLGRVTTATLIGADAQPICVETHIGQGLPAYIMVGLPDGAVRESRVRIEAALKSCGFDLPSRHNRVLINLAPADLRKEGSGLDLPMALSVLASHGDVPEAALQSRLVVGELGLDGSLRPISGAVIYALLARRLGYTAVVVPPENAREAKLVPGVDVLTATHLRELVQALRGEGTFAEVVAAAAVSEDRAAPCLSDVVGLSAAKRALEIAAIGGHHVLLSGPPGHGKTMLAERFIGLLPPLNEARRLEVMALHSLQRGLPRLSSRPPFRAPHHTLSTIALIGGGSSPRPGEVSLAHRGVLFLEEFAEFHSDTLNALRQPMESGEVLISRARKQVSFLAAFQLIAATNPCPCGNRGHPSFTCECAPVKVQRYEMRLKGPVFDRIDMNIYIGTRGGAERRADTSAQIAERVARARAFAGDRSQSRLNRQMRGKELKPHLSPGAKGLLEMLCESAVLSGRGADSVLRVARSIADSKETFIIDEDCVTEAHFLRHRGSADGQNSGFVKGGIDVRREDAGVEASNERH